MRTENINIYQFDELSDEAKNKARDWWRNGYEFDVSYVLDNFKAEMEEFGVEVSKFTYSVSYSQRDGAGFDYEINLLEWLKVNAPKKSYMLIRRLLKENKIANAMRGTQGFNWQNATHYNGVEVYDDFHVSARMTVYIEGFEADIFKWMENKADDLYSRIRDELDYMHSDDHIDECLRINEYEFTESGVLW